MLTPRRPASGTCVTAQTQVSVGPYHGAAGWAAQQLRAWPGVAEVPVAGLQCRR